jgi:hypothetical protein
MPVASWRLWLLILPLAGCVSLPKDLSSTRPTAHARHRVTLQPLIEPSQTNQTHARDARAGSPVLHAQIEFDGGMPHHVHGLPTRFTSAAYVTNTVRYCRASSTSSAQRAAEQLGTKLFGKKFERAAEIDNDAGVTSRRRLHAAPQLDR